MDTHSSGNTAVMGSDRSFGAVFACLFVLIGLYPVWHGSPVRFWALGAAATFAACALFAPHLLKPLNKAWFNFGLAVGKVMTPVVMSLIYILTVVPIGLILRATGKDLLRLQKQPEADSYWIERKNSTGSMRQQF